MLKALHSRRSSVPVLVATSRDGVTDRIAGLDAGTGDYAAKPYDTDKLLARVRALLRRSARRDEPAFEHKGVSLIPASHEATVNGQPVLLQRVNGRCWSRCWQGPAWCFLERSLKKSCLAGKTTSAAMR